MKTNYFMWLILPIALYGIPLRAQDIALNGQKNLPGANLKHLVVGNLSGEIKILAGDKNEVGVSWSGHVESEGKKNFRSDEFKVNVNASGDTAWVFLETPCGSFKPSFGKKNKFFDWKDCDLDADIEVNYSITIPRHLTVYASNMNEGDINLDGLNNHATLSHLNGNIKVTNHQAKADLSTLNGDIECAFKSVNNDPCTFNNLNGSIKIEVPASFSAQVKFKSLHGDLFTNIDNAEVSYQTETTTANKKHNDVFNIKIGSNQVVKFGSGTSKWTTETLNGNVYIRKK